MFENKPSSAPQEPEDMFADTVSVQPQPSRLASVPESTRTGDIPELAGPVFSPGKLWTTIGAIVVVLALVGGGVWWFWWRPKQQSAASTTANQPVTQPEVQQPLGDTTPPPVTDEDQDGLTDAEEAQLGTSATNVDTDGDGLLDAEEVRTWKTNPLKVDSDDDGYSDKQEIDNGYNPNGAGKLMNVEEDIKKLGN
ncbi:hypothetical protein HY624_00850 [Candidatus Uhrbacteria bacterium]|nr:hypothetical protein [Candidatus Uhrbacteria bacterium]